ncbi:MAG: LysR family transcriptional regulator [Paracoccaceae bacterium]
MKVDPSQLEVLAAIVDCGGLTEGAAFLGKSQPSLSRTVAMLEARLGTSLFLQGKRPLRATELGLRLAEEGRRILLASAAASDAVASYRAGKAGAVRMGGTPIFMDGVIVAMIAGFQMQNPDVRIEQSYGYAGELSERVINGTLDLAICPMRAEDVPIGLLFDGVLPGRNVIACREGHPLAHAHAVTAADLLRFAWIAPPANSPLYQDLQRVLSSLGAEKFRISYSGGSLSAVMEMLAGSDSLTVLPYSVVFTLRRQYRIGALSIKIEHPDRRLGVLSAKGVNLSPAAKRLRSFVLGQFESLAATILHRERQSVWRR